MKIIDYTQIGKNIEEIKKNHTLCMVLKSDAYGFGLERMVSLGVKHGVESFAVNHIREAIQVRKLSELPILLLGKYDGPIQNLKEYRVIPTAQTEEDIYTYIEHKIMFAVEIDCGMNRFGFKELKEEVLNSPYLSLVYLHLYSKTKKNEAWIQKWSTLCSKYNKTFQFGGSIACEYPGYIRIGRRLYQDALSFYGRVIEVKEVNIGETIGYDGTYEVKMAGRIAILDVGYSNGLPVFYRGKVFYGGNLYPVVGKVCMNHCFIWVDEDIKEGMYMEFFGSSIPLEQYSTWSCKTVYECFLSIR